MKKYLGLRWCWMGLFVFAVQLDAQWKPIITSDGGIANTSLKKETPIALVKSDSMMYVASSTSIYRSTDNGATWDITAPTTASSIGHNTALAVAGNNLIAATSNGNFRSADQGRIWSPLSLSPWVYVFAINGSALYAGSEDGVYRSLNDGITWEALNVGMKYKDVLTLAFSETGEIFAGTDGGVFRSKDAGASWVNIGPAGVQVKALAVNGGMLLVGTMRGLYRSADSGATWNASNANYPEAWYHSLVVVNGGDIFAGTSNGAFYSRDDGYSWTQVNQGIANSSVPSVYALYVNGANLYAGLSGAGVWKRPLSEMTVAPPSPRLDAPADEAADVTIGPTFTWNAVSGADSYEFQLSTNSNFSPIEMAWSNVVGPSCSVNGLAYHTNYYWRVKALNAAGSSAWSTRSFSTMPSALQPQWVRTGPPPGLVYSLAVFGKNLFAGTRYSGVFCSTNDGLSWERKNIGFIGQTTVNDLFAFGTTLVAALTDVYNSGGVYISTDSGATWTNACAGLAYQTPTSVAALDSTLFVGTYGAGIYMSANKGMNWTPVNNGLTNTNVSSLAVSGTKLFAATSGGVFLTTDNGAHWKSVSEGLPNAGVATLAVAGTNLVAATYYDGVYRSTDSGAHWTEANAGLTNNYVYRFAVAGTNLFAGVGYHYASGGVYLSTNGGISWSSVNAGLDSVRDITTLAVSGTTLYAMDDVSYTLWRRPLSEMLTAVKTHTDDVPASFGLNQNFPNPFNPSTTISFSIPARSFVSLKIFDLLGREVAALASEVMPAGSYSRHWNASGLASGVYFYRLQADSHTEIKRMLLLK